MRRILVLFSGKFLLAALACYVLSIHVYFMKNDTARNQRATHIQSDSADFDEHFLRSLRPYTVHRVANRGLVHAKYVSKRSLSRVERVCLQWFINDYRSFHRQNRNDTGRYLLHVPRRTGFGDRIQYLIFAYWLAALSRRVLLVDWRDPFPLDDVLSSSVNGLNLFYDERVDGQRNICNRSDSTSGHVTHMNQTKLDGAHDEKAVLSEVRCVVSFEYKRASRISDSFFQFYSPKNVTPQDLITFRKSTTFARALFHHIFQLSPVVRNVHMRYAFKHNLRFPTFGPRGLRTIGRRKQGTPYIAVHARIGYGVGEGGWRFENVSKQQSVIAKCLASRALQLSGISSERKLPIFLATDTPQFREIFRNKVANMSKGTVSVYTGDWDVIHSNRIPRISKRLHDNSKENEVLLNSFLDLSMIGHALHIVSLYSSFPRMALGFGDAGSLTELRNDICLEKDSWS